MACKTCRRALRGVRGLAKSAMGIDKPDDPTVQKRRKICEACPRLSKNSTGIITKRSKCMECTCYYIAKTRLQKEKCPLGKW